MEKANLLIEKLESLTNKKVTLIEGTVDKNLKKKFYSVSADFERELKRLIKFYENHSSQYVFLKEQLKKIKRIETTFEDIFFNTEVGIDNESQQEKQE